ncbi:MAG: glycosyltransferase [Candidatus Uhrbacteria bacterium]
MVHVVLPTYNEAAIIEENLTKLLDFMQTRIAEEWHITVADNISTDATRGIVARFAAQHPKVTLLTLDTLGKGNAILTAWMRTVQEQGTKGGEQRTRDKGQDINWVSDTEHPASDVFVFMDADIATELDALPHLIQAIRSGADVAIGTRYSMLAHANRSIFRHCCSRMNHLLLRLLFGLRVSDAPCGFKAVNEHVVRTIVPCVEDRMWFFDTELIIRAQRAGCSIAEVPVRWHEPRSGNALRKVIAITKRNLGAMYRLFRSLH